MPTGLFCDPDLAREIERCDRAAMRCAVDAVRQRRPHLDPFAVDFAGGLAVYGGPRSPYNKVVALGHEVAPSDDELDALEARYAERGEGVSVELCTLAEPSLGRRLTERGYRLVGHEQVLGARLPTEPVETNVRVGLVDDTNFDDWVAAITDGFLDADGSGVEAHETFGRAELEEAIGDSSLDPKMFNFAASIDDQLAAGGSVRIDGRFACLCGAATRPQFRRRGAQTALLSARLRFAADRGAELVTVTTQPGSRSTANAIKHGFAVIFGRNILQREFQA